MDKLVISASPHVHGGNSIKKDMTSVLTALLPAWAVAVYRFGWNALTVTLIAIASCFLFEWLIKRLMMKEPIRDGSFVITGILLAFCLPSSTPWWIVVIGAFVAIAIGKMSFGGLGHNIFNPALVGRVFLLISFPVQLTSWPVPAGFATSDAVTAATPLFYAKEATRLGTTFASEMAAGGGLSLNDMLLGNMGGCLGEVCAVALLLGLWILLIRRTITWHIPVSIIATVFIASWAIYLATGGQTMPPLTQILTGGVLLGAIFMATDYVTSPMTSKGMILYGVLIGLLTVVIRTWGAYPEGMSFAILIMNGVTPLINKYSKTKRFDQ